MKNLKTAQDCNLYEFKNIGKSNLRDDIWRFANDIGTSVLEKFAVNTISLSDYTNGGIYRGLTTGLNKAFIINQGTRDEIIKKDPNATSILRKEVEGEDFGKWYLKHSGKYMVATGYDLDIPNLYPSVYQYLHGFENDLIKRQDKGQNYYNLRACVYYTEFEKPKLIYQIERKTPIPLGQCY